MVIGKSSGTSRCCYGIQKVSEFPADTEHKAPVNVAAIAAISAVLLRVLIQI
jgi:hypothetical protein